MSKNDMVRVPRKWAESVVGAGPGEPVCRFDLETLRAAIAEQHQGEPVGYTTQQELEILKGGNIGSVYPNDVLTKIPLYTRVDPAEVEGLREQLAEANGRIRTLEAVNEAGTWADTATDKENDALRALLAKVLLSGALTAPEHEALEAECCALSASVGSEVRP